jgi:bifunctional UDP-N-acetylglucosamine pyrophosphorylase/glucosamine-1-phosphate N-acetyltransferase
MKCQALILAAGKGTRMKSGLAKVLHRALDRPMLEYVLHSINALAPDPITIVTGHGAESVEAAYADRGFRFVRQEPQLGTGHAVQAARRVIEEHQDRPLLVLGGDTPLLRHTTIAEMLDAHVSSGCAATLLSCRIAEPGAYGRIIRDESGNVRGIVEARDAADEERAISEINIGAYVFSVPELLSVLSLLNGANAQGELYLTDVIGLLAAGGSKIQSTTIADRSEAIGVNTMEELAEATKRLSARCLGALMRNGVIVEDPNTTFVGTEVVVEADAVLRPFTILEGRTKVRARARIGPFARLVDTEVGEGAEILDHCLLRESVVDTGASVGPFTHIRPGSRVGSRAKVGNFVELKKTSLGDGSKAPHLSYLGDATIGPKTNVGAGTITCNYDGTRKHPTHIGSGAFVGSHTTLVAPIIVGDGAYVGAGSTVTEDVPPGALALGRARQVVKPGWAERRRERDSNRRDNNAPRDERKARG